MAPLAPDERNIVLIGPMGSGKSTVAMAIGERLGRRVIDTDAAVERAAGCSIADLWAREGEDAFRDLEEEAVKKACAARGAVIATGGGALLRMTSFAFIEGAGVVVYLRAAPDTLWERAGKDRARPLAADRAAFDRVLAERTPVYESAADVIVETDGRTVAEIVDEIVAVA